MIGLTLLDRPTAQNAEDRVSLLDQLRETGVREAMVLATCARCELYTLGNGGVEAARHLFRVCSGLDSPVLGETEIVAQVKEAWTVARTQGMVGPELDLLLRHAMRAGKRVRTETDLCRGVVSYAGLAVREASAQARGLGDKRILVIGAGDMGERVLRELRRTPPKQVTVVSRTLRRAQSLAAKYGHGAAPYGSVAAELERSDILFGALSDVVAPLGRYVPPRPLVAVDLGEPPCIPSSLTERPDVAAINLTTIVSRCLANVERRTAAVAIAERILDEEMERYQAAVRTREARLA